MREVPAMTKQEKPKKDNLARRVLEDLEEKELARLCSR
jgi:hypothetical protein